MSLKLKLINIISGILISLLILVSCNRKTDYDHKSNRKVDDKHRVIVLDGLTHKGNCNNHNK